MDGSPAGRTVSSSVTWRPKPRSAARSPWFGKATPSRSMRETASSRSTSPSKSSPDAARSGGRPRHAIPAACSRNMRDSSPAAARARSPMVDRVAIQGEAGSFSHAAAIETHGPALQLVPCPTFVELFRAVEEGKATRGMVPIENTLAGSVHENYDLLSAHDLHVVSETELRIRHCLIAPPRTTLDAIRRVASHPVALAQCRQFFLTHPDVEAVPAYDTAGSVRDV